MSGLFPKNSPLGEEPTSSEKKAVHTAKRNYEKPENKLPNFIIHNTSNPANPLPLSVYVYIHLHIYTQLLYIYTYREREIVKARLT